MSGWLLPAEHLLCREMVRSVILMCGIWQLPYCAVCLTIVFSMLRHLDALIMGNALYGGGNPARMACTCSRVSGIACLPDDRYSMLFWFGCCWCRIFAYSQRAGQGCAGGWSRILESFSYTPASTALGVTRGSRIHPAAVFPLS